MDPLLKNNVVFAEQNPAIILAFKEAASKDVKLTEFLSDVIAKIQNSDPKIKTLEYINRLEEI